MINSYSATFTNTVNDSQYLMTAMFTGAVAVTDLISDDASIDEKKSSVFYTKQKLKCMRILRFAEIPRIV